MLQRVCNSWSKGSSVFVDASPWPTETLLYTYLIIRTSCACREGTQPERSFYAQRATLAT